MKTANDLTNLLRLLRFDEVQSLRVDIISADAAHCVLNERSFRRQTGVKGDTVRPSHLSMAPLGALP